MEGVENSGAPTGSPRWKRIAKWLAISVAGLVAIVFVAVLAINTGPGRAFLVSQLSGYETASGMKIGIGRINGSLYGRMRISRLEVRDTQGVFLQADHLTLDWRPFEYLTASKVNIRGLLSPEIVLRRLPVFEEVPSDPDAPILPDIDVSLGRLTIDRFVVEPPVTGKRHIVRIAGKAEIADGRAQVTADAAALRAAGVAGGDKVAILLDAVPDANRLRLDADVIAPAGGLIDSYAGLGKAVAFRLGGKGDWKAWNGRLRGTIGGASVADLTIAARDGRFRVQGPTMPGVVLAGPVERVTAPKLDVDLDATLGERLFDVKFTARSDALAVDAGGTIHLGRSRFGNFQINAALLKAGAIAPNVSGKDIKASAVLDGAFATPAVAYRISAERAAFGSMGVEGLRAEGRATIDADRIAIPVSATARRVTGLNAAAGGLLTDLSVNGDLAWSKGKLLSDNLHLKSARIDATAIILADLATGTYTGALKGRVNDYHVDGLGRVALTTDTELVPGANGGFGVRGAFRVVTKRIDNETLRNTLGGNAVTIGRFGFDGRVARLTGLAMTAPDFRITGGGGSYDLETGRIDFRAGATSKLYGPATVTASGTLERPLVQLRAARPELGINLTGLAAELRGVAGGYAIRATGSTDYGPLSGDILIRSGSGPLAVDIRRATFAGVDFVGSVVQSKAGPFAGRLTLAGSGLNGGVRLSAAGANQQADIDVTANAARIPGPTPITLGRGTIKARAVMYPAAPSITGRFALADLRQGETLVGRAQGRIDYRRGRGTVALTANGRSGVPFDVAAQARLAPDRIVANAKGSVGNTAFRLSQPAVATKAGADWVLAPVRLVVPQGTVELSGRYGQETRFRARMDNFDIAIAQAFVPGLGLGGRATGNVDYSQAAGSDVPNLRARIDVKNFTRTAAYVVSDPVDIAFLGTLDRSGGDMRALIRRGGGLVGRMIARLAPLGPGASLSEQLFASPLSGGVRYNGPADVLWTMTGISGQDLSGPVAVAADFGGRLDRPTVNGIARAKTLRYENTAFGTVISNIALEGRFTQSQLQLVSLTGKAGTGSLSASGTVGLDAATGFPINLQARLDRAQLAQSDALGATVSGTMTITNGPGGGLIKGDFRIPEARYQVVLQGAAEVADLSGVRRRTDKPAAKANAPAPSNWKLDIRIRADNQIFVGGMGLEAEWATDMRVSGTATDPRVVGTLSVVRGTYSFAGRRFDLDDDGEIRFDGGPLTNPELNLSADTTVEGVTATISIGGRAQNPQVTFTSTPTLPQDEVLSRLLFGESVTSLSPTQAIQLAAALNSLRGSGGGLNPLGKLRSATGIDRLRVLGADKTAGRGTALAAGQYISNDIYVEVITDARGFTATQLEIALSKALSLLSQAGSFGGSNVGLRYSKDY
ncbi:translocation/assembly module TamB domain-containing protein [Sphingomonas sp. ID0503]|uniref:translocation/assembly module TamB domain-containing protein n=1 Tax=Sphingomonas sp. ID0503 TaxID=3399691 RepID=UPI003AFB58BD